MSSDPEQIRHDIEHTRAELSSDVDALSHKVNPRRIASVPVTRARGRLSRIVDRVMGTARHTRDATVHQAHAVGHRVSDTAHQGAGAMTNAAHQTSDAMTNAAHQTSDAVSAAGDRVQSLTHASKERAEGNPLAAGVIAFGVGMLASALLPPSRKEQQLAERARHEAMEHADQVKQKAGDMMHQVQDNLREPVQEASQAVKSTASRGATTLRDAGTEQAQHVRDDARQASHRM
jgi:ElaB/YqjD/DUF883 family membrane-anchored ribosome-binding protein